MQSTLSNPQGSLILFLALGLLNIYLLGGYFQFFVFVFLVGVVLKPKRDALAHCLQSFIASLNSLEDSNPHSVPSQKFSHSNKETKKTYITELLQTIKQGLKNSKKTFRAINFAATTIILIIVFLSCFGVLIGVVSMLRVDIQKMIIDFNIQNTFNFVLKNLFVESNLGQKEFDQPKEFASLNDEPNEYIYTNVRAENISDFSSSLGLRNDSLTDHEILRLDLEGSKLLEIDINTIINFVNHAQGLLLDPNSPVKHLHYATPLILLCLNALSECFFLIPTFFFCLLILLQLPQDALTTVLSYLPETQTRDKIHHILVTSIERSFACSIKIFLSHLCLTWLTFCYFKLSFANTLSILTATFSTFPLISAWLFCVPHAIYLTFQNNGLFTAILFISIFTILSMKVYQDICKASIENVHPYITSLSIVLGLYSFGAFGIIYGPLIVSLTVHASDYLEKPRDNLLNRTQYEG